MKQTTFVVLGATVTAFAFAPSANAHEYAAKHRHGDQYGAEYQHGYNRGIGHDAHKRSPHSKHYGQKRHHHVHKHYWKKRQHHDKFQPRTSYVYPNTYYRAPAVSHGSNLGLFYQNEGLNISWLFR